MKLLIDELLKGKCNLNKIKRLTKEDKQTIISFLLNQFTIEKNKSEKLKLAFIINEIKNY